jgi:hypothetical protein
LTCLKNMALTDWLYKQFEWKNWFGKNNFKKMKILISVMAGFFLMNMAFAQNEEALKKIEAARIGLITERLGLTAEQAEKFWPLYNEYTEKVKEFRRELVTARQGVDLSTATEAEKRMLIEKGLKLKEMESTIERDYSERLLRVISSQQMLGLKKAEDDFREMLLQRLQNQREQRIEGQRGGKPQERIDRRRN